MSDAMDMFRSMLAGDATEYSFLPTFDQDLARKSQSIIQRAFNEFGNAEELVARTWLRKAFFDALDRSGAWATTNTGAPAWSAQPQLFYPMERVERGARPNPVLMTVPSMKTTNAFVAMISFRDVNFQGYGELATASFNTVSEVFGSAQAAEDFARELAGAIKYSIYTLPALVSRNAQRGEVTTVGYTDAPDF